MWIKKQLQICERSFNKNNLSLNKLNSHLKAKLCNYKSNYNKTKNDSMYFILLKFDSHN